MSGNKKVNHSIFFEHDFRHLRDINCVAKLNLMFSDISNIELAYIKFLTNLLNLNLGYTLIGDAGLKYLKPLTNLVEINLTGTKVSKAGITELRKALPNCKIGY